MNQWIPPTPEMVRMLCLKGVDAFKVCEDAERSWFISKSDSETREEFAERVIEAQRAGAE